AGLSRTSGRAKVSGSFVELWRSVAGERVAVSAGRRPGEPDRSRSHSIRQMGRVPHRFSWKGSHDHSRWPAGLSSRKRAARPQWFRLLRARQGCRVAREGFEAGDCAEVVPMRRLIASGLLMLSAFAIRAAEPPALVNEPDGSFAPRGAS